MLRSRIFFEANIITILWVTHEEEKKLVLKIFGPGYTVLKRLDLDQGKIDLEPQHGILAAFPST